MTLVHCNPPVTYSPAAYFGGVTAVKSGQRAHIVKGIKKGKAKPSATQLGKWNKGDKDIVPAEAPILMISTESHTSKRKSVEEPVDGVGEIMFPPISSFNNASDPVIIKA
ncbi:hypothetical protein Tco_0670641 [Tanacetum coccineum]